MKKLVVGITSPISVILIKGQLRYFSERGFKVFLLAPDHADVRDLCEKENATLLAVNFRREISLVSDFLSFLKVVYLLARISPDIINMGTPKVSLLGIVAGFLLRIKNRIYTCRGFRFEHETGIKRGVLAAMEKLTGSLASRIICISPSIRTMAIDQGIFSPEKCTVIGPGSSNGVDLIGFNHGKIDLNVRENDRQALNLCNRFVFGFAGRLIDRKGVAELIKAFNVVKRDFPEIALLMVGHTEMDQLSDESVVAEIKSNPDIISVGWQSDVVRYLSLMHVFVLPAWWEGFGNVLIQAAAMGIPVISTFATGTQDAVKDGFNGTLVPPRNVEELGRVMKRYYMDRELCKVHGANGIEWAKKFESTEIWKGIEELYDKR